MSTATERLARAIAAETRLLAGAQEVRMDLGNGSYRSYRDVDLDALRLLIKELEAQVRAENANATRGGFGFSLANLSGE